MSDNNKNNHCVYMHENKINHKKYIGQAVNNPQTRWRKDGKGYYNYNKPDNLQSYFYNAIKKYGWDNFNHIILKENLTLEEANYWEEYYIAYYHTWKNDPECMGYNDQKGGNNHEISEETKQKIRETKLKLHLKHTDEWKQQASIRSQGENNPFYGKHHSEETKQKMCDNHADFKGSKSSCAKPIMCVETGEIFGSARDAGEWCSRSKNAILNCVNGRSQTAGGYHWKKVEENE